MTNKKSRSPQIPQRKPIRPIERQKMRPWLLELLKSGRTIPGFGWVNKKEKTFRISWRHAARHGWDPSVDAPLYQLWAKHTGKFIDGDEHDPKRWKANFRCALNSLPDVQEERSASVRKGVNAFRVYRFLDEKKSKSQASKQPAPVEVKSEFNTTTKTKRTLRMRNRKISYAKMVSTDAEEEEDVTSDYGSYGDASPLRSESNDFSFTSSSGSDTDSSQYNEQKPNIPSSVELPVFDQICKSSDLNSFINMLPKKSPQHTVDYSMSALSGLTSSRYVDDELASTTSSDMTDDEVVQMILDVQNDPIKDEPMSPYRDCDETPLVTDAVIVTDESGEYIVLENCTVANEVVIRDTPNVTTQQVMGEEMLYYTSIEEL